MSDMHHYTIHYNYFENGSYKSENEKTVLAFTAEDALTQFKAWDSIHVKPYTECKIFGITPHPDYVIKAIDESPRYEISNTQMVAILMALRLFNRPDVKTLVKELEMTPAIKK